MIRDLLSPQVLAMAGWVLFLLLVLFVVDHRRRTTRREFDRQMRELAHQERMAILRR